MYLVSSSIGSGSSQVYNIYSYICSPSDVDYFKVIVDSPVTSLSVSEAEGYYGKDYDLYLYDSSHNEIARSATIPVYGGVNMEFITYFLVSPTGEFYVPQGTYYIKVIGYNGAYATDRPYLLSVLFSYI